MRLAGWYPSLGRSEIGEAGVRQVGGVGQSTGSRPPASSSSRSSAAPRHRTYGLHARRPLVSCPPAHGVRLARPTPDRLRPSGTRRAADQPDPGTGRPLRTTSPHLEAGNLDRPGRRVLIGPEVATRYRASRRTASTGCFTGREATRPRLSATPPISSGEIWSVPSALGLAAAVSADNHHHVGHHAAADQLVNADRRVAAVRP